jgi:putative transposase
MPHDCVERRTFSWQLQRISKKESRFRKHQNHCISKTIVSTAKRTGRGLALEDLKGIREQVTARGGDARNRLSGWSFHQLYSFLSYKATLAGVPVVQVDPRYTSQTCAECSHREKSNRKSQAEFQCKACGHELHAAVNAARNIRALAFSKQATGLADLKV